jgi:hypothetical protein
LKARTTENLDHLLETGIENLLRGVDGEWLNAEAEKPHRLNESYLNSRLHLVNGVRIAPPQAATPNRFAQMLLVSLNFLEKREDLDFFSAATFLPEIAALGNSLPEIQALGIEAVRKLSSLGSMPDDLVSSTIYELLVGAAWIRRGHSITMTPENREKKVPDFTVAGLGGGFTTVVECKRRLGLSNYELKEAEYVADLYEAIQGPLRERVANISIDVAFALKLEQVPKANFVEPVLRTALDRSYDEHITTSWGTFVIRQLHSFKTVIPTRLYSPDFLESAFGWNADQDEWDGILCEVEPPTDIIVGSLRSPLCLKWRSESETALLKKSRGILSLWADAVKQVAAGDIGFVYIAYPEGSRAAVADSRTREVLKSLKECWHDWKKRVPVTVVNRLYARTAGSGVPDFIENSLRGVSEGQEFWFEDFHIPWMVFTRQFE